MKGREVSSLYMRLRGYEVALDEGRVFVLSLVLSLILLLPSLSPSFSPLPPSRCSNFYFLFPHFPYLPLSLFHHRNSSTVVDRRVWENHEVGVG